MDVTGLVAVASKHGATAEIGERLARSLAETLSARGLRVQLDVCAADRVAGVDQYDVVIVGSAVYAGRWLRPAVGLVEANREALRAKSVWLFSSGPVGVPALPADIPAEPRRLAELVHAREHRMLAGKLHRAGLRLTERAVVNMVGAADGDFRDWPAVDQWATQIAADIARSHKPRPVPAVDRSR